MRKPLLIATAVLLFTALNGCGVDQQTEVSPAFYHWKTRFELSPSAEQLRRQLNSDRLYVKFFDVDWDYKLKTPVPMAEVIWSSKPTPSAEIIPTIFITNRVLKELPIQEIPGLANNIAEKMDALLPQSGWKNIDELQMDCDWTAGTRDHYFRLLKELKSILSAQQIKLSATIRLHQIKYPEQTGVPPADRGMLMFYNMGDLSQWEEPNSILNLEKARPYLTGLADYPLPLDLALPLFHWGVIFRDGEMIRLINQLNERQLSDRERFYPLGEKRYEVVRHTFLDGTFLYQGDFIRLEGVDTSALLQAAQLLKDYPWPRAFHLSFYHLDSTTQQQFSARFLEKIVEEFK